MTEKWETHQQHIDEENEAMLRDELEAARYFEQEAEAWERVGCKGFAKRYRERASEERAKAKEGANHA